MILPPLDIGLARYANMTRGHTYLYRCGCFQQKLCGILVGANYCAAHRARVGDSEGPA